MKTLKLSAFLLALLLLVPCFAGCGGEKTPEPQKTDDTPENEDPADDPHSGEEGEFMIELADTLTLTSADLASMETKSGKRAAVSIDIVCQLYEAVMTEAKVRQQLVSIKNLGVTRVYLILCSPSYPVMSGGCITALKDGLSDSRVAKSLDTLGKDPNEVYIRLCHELGLEAIAVVKPYEGGGGYSIPDGKTLDAVASKYAQTVTPACIGGSRAFIDDFIAEHPEMRVKRKTGTGENLAGNAAVTSAVLDFQWGATAAPDVAAVNASSDNVPTLWVSRDNETYEPYANFTYEYTYVPNTAIVDPNGESVFSKNVLRLTLKIEGLTAADKYLAVTYTDKNVLRTASCWQRPYSMIHLFNGTTELPNTFGYYVRKPAGKMYNPGAYATEIGGNTAVGIRVNGNTATAVDAAGKTVNGVGDFTKYGLEYEFVYTSAVMNGVMSPVIGMAVGKNEYVQGMLCEGYEEVRAYWLDQVNTALSYGADGIDIRLDSHSCMVSDYYYYGYNDPIAAAYLEKYGKALDAEPVCKETAVRVMLIRGEFYVKFLESASKAAHDAGKLFLTHFFATSYGEEDGEGNWNPTGASNCFAQWKNPKIIVDDYRHVIDLCDEIVYKDYFSQTYSKADQKQGEALTSYAHQQGKKVWIHCYVQQSPQQLNDGFMTAFAATKYADAVTLYEINVGIDLGPWADVLSRYVYDLPEWSLSIMGRITVAKTVTVGELLSSLAMLGETVVIDAKGNSVKKTETVTSDMRVLLNRTVVFNLSVNS